MFLVPIAAFCTAYYTVNVVGLHMAIKRAFKINPAQRIKPLDCVNCLSVWMALVFYFAPHGVTECFSLCFGAGFISTKIK